MKSELFFGINASYNLTLNNLLKEKSAVKFWDRGKGKYVYLFHISRVKEIEALIGAIEIPLLREKFEKEKIRLPLIRGKDFIDIRTLPTMYQVIEHRKQEDGTVKEKPWNVSKSIVDEVWKVITHLPEGKNKARDVAERICKALGITRFSRETGSFDYAKFFGNRMYGYYKYYYLPVKVLQHQKKIIHYKSGHIQRL